LPALAPARRPRTKGQAGARAGKSGKV